MGKPADGKAMIEAAKNKVKETKKQTEKENNIMNKKHIIVTIVLTVAFLASLATAFVYGINYEKSVNNRVVSEVQSLVTATAELKK